MKLATSYFYQIRNFKKNMIPISTAIWDPSWFHNFTKDYNYIFKDKRGIINGIRCLSIIECGRNAHSCHGRENCNINDPAHCPFLKSYKENLDTIDFNELITGLEELAENYKKQEKINEEITIVFIVYETPSNPCSEREAIIDYFTKHKIECKELDYPIILNSIKEESFDF